METTIKVAEYRKTWKKNIDFIFNILGWIVGLGNVWRFPYLCYKNGGGAFLLAYSSLILLLIFPLMVLESAVGQFTGVSVLKAWRIVPISSGIGFATVQIIIYSNMYYPVILAWALRWFVASFSSTLPWTTCGNDWNTDNCVDVLRLTVNRTMMNMTSSENINISTSMETTRSSSIEEFWRINILGMTLKIEDPGLMRWDLLACLFIVWILTYFSIWKGIGWTSKIIYVTSTLPLAMLLVVTVRGLTLSGAASGIRFYMKPNVTKLAEFEIWRDAATQVIYSLGVCGGVIPTMSAFNKFNHNFLRDLIILITANAMVSFIAGFAIFSVLGFLAQTQNVTVADVAESGPGLAFVVYPTALALLPFPQLWSALFFLMLVLLGLDTMFVSQEILHACLEEIFPKFYQRKWGHEMVVAFTCTLEFIFGIYMVTGGGIYVLNIMNEYAAAGWCMFFIACSEFITVAWLYGADKMFDNINQMLGYNIPRLCFKICWKFLGPMLTAILMIYSFVDYRPLTYDRTYVYPAWANVLGLMLSLSSSLWIPGMAIYVVWKSEGQSLTEKLCHAVRKSGSSGRDRSETIALNSDKGSVEADESMNSAM